MNDLTSFPRADSGLVPNVPVNELYERIRALITAREDWDGVLKSLLKKPDPYEVWTPDHVQHAACEFLEPLIENGYVPVYFEDERGDFRSVPSTMFCVHPSMAGQTGAGEKRKLLTFTRGIAEFIDLPAKGRVIAGRSLFMAPDAKLKIDQSFAYRFPQKVEQTVDQEAAKRELVARLNSARRWHLAEVLFWIGTRSIEKMAGYLVDAHSPDTAMPYYKVNAGFLVCVISLVFSPRPGIVSHGFGNRPADELVAALKSGDVTALGVFEGRGRREPIPAHDWNYLEFRDQSGCLGRIIASRTSGTNTLGNYLHGLNGAWFDVDFDRVEIMSAFPDEATPLPVASPANVRIVPHGPSKADEAAFAEWMAQGVNEGNKRTREEAEAWAAKQGIAKHHGKTWHSKADPSLKRLRGEKKGDK